MARTLIASRAMSDKPRDLRDRTFLFACDIVKFCRELGKEPGASRQISWQLLDSGTSIGANTEEAKGAYSRREFAAKNSIVLRECRETLFWLRVILATGLAPAGRVEPLRKEADELVAIFTATVRRARLPQTVATALVVLVFIAVLLSSSF
jgi:four helix bundle protein